VARNIVGLWVINQSNGASVNIDVDRVNNDGSFTLEANHSGGAVTGNGAGNMHGNELHFTINWNNNTQGAYIGAFGPDGFLNGSTFDIRNPNSHASWRSNRAF
jgi:hypothetical protein